jgi:hypothetical protein
MVEFDDEITGLDDGFGHGPCSGRLHTILGQKLQSARVIWLFIALPPRTGIAAS